MGVVLLRSVPMYPALGVCVCGDVRLYRCVDDHCFIYKAGRKPFLVCKIILTHEYICHAFYCITTFSLTIFRLIEVLTSHLQIIRLMVFLGS